MDKVKKSDLLINMLIGLLIAVLGIVNWHLRVDVYRFFFDIGELLVLFVVLSQMPGLELTLRDNLLLVSLLLLGKFLLPIVYIPNLYMPRTVPFTLLLLLALLFLVKTVHETKAGYGCTVVLATGICLLTSWLFNKGEQYVYDLHLNWKQSAALLAGALYIFIAGTLGWFAAKYISRLVRSPLVALQEFSKKYKEIDTSSLMVAILTLVCMMLTEMLPLTEHIADNMLPILWISLCAVVVMIQFVYIRLLVKSISLKEEMRLQETDRETLTRYNHDLESNMESLRDVRHDIKNLFLTMGGFVEKSGDPQMQAFYRENIVPFAYQELQRSDLYTKLTQIQDESLKSFLYYKIMQGIEQSVSIDLEIQLFEDCYFGIAQIDLIRILGILIDNAIEEAVCCNGTVSIHIKESADEYSFSIRNSTRQQTRERGVIAGTTDKGLGRGKGLLIVEKIICKYNNLLLNSFFKEDDFVQYLRIAKS